MHIYTEQDAEALRRAYVALMGAEADALLLCAMPPLFAMPEKLVRELVEQTGDEALLLLWRHELTVFRRYIKKHRLSVTLLDPALAVLAPEALCALATGSDTVRKLPYTNAQYAMHIDRLRQLQKQYENLRVRFRTDVSRNILLHVKENTGVIMEKTDRPISAFVFNDRTMIDAFWDYLMA